MQIGGAVHALVVCFASDEEESNLKQFWSLSYLETGSGSSTGKMTEGDQAWAIKASEAGEDEDEPMEDAMQYEENDEKRGAQSTREYPESTYGDEEDDEQGASSSNIRVGGSAAAAASSSSAAGAGGGDHNDNLAVGQLLNRTFVNRGTQIGVFKHGNSGDLEYVNNVPIVRDLNKEAFAPSEMMVGTTNDRHCTAPADARCPLSRRFLICFSLRCSSFSLSRSCTIKTRRCCC